SRLAQQKSIDLPTQARALVCGRVLRAGGACLPQPVTVCAYPLRDGTPRQTCLTATRTDASGEYQLQTAMSGELLLVAVETKPFDWQSTRLACPVISEMMDAEWQPAAALCTVRVGAVTSAPSIALANSARLVVTVTDASGPAAGELLALTYSPDALLTHSPDPFSEFEVCWWRDGSCAATWSVQTDNQGRAVLLGAAGHVAHLAVGGNP